ncbi:MAG: T9SS type A sorting domain-containing protein [Sphingobacteriales bacterium]|jgi:hypothetical protein|nr:T9SS type A sorting domain-containing protein [Sphingobacteriales bacterium]MBP9141702.1 T9SS type A sorting domain-containing protein [Chitinophagales bacterium]MDA0198497.1 T9SS type A sorting domain-containing protein [Bacteroidota bacterium]MBK6888598.1 T9SS type A sorting domain-containing protein [Sphingobacteriales bacterium]MBK7528894.1 T9SS type A sorting domain-containing protein [Sphingobacteriales bacterium]
MKNLLLFVALAFIANLNMLGQSIFTVEPSQSVYVNGDPNVYEIIGHANVKYNGTQAATITWERTTNNLAGEKWRSLICDKVTCWSPTKSSNSFELQPGETTLMDTHINSPNASIGNGTGFVVIKVTATDPGTGNVLGTVEINYTFDTWKTGLQKPTDLSSEIRLYPNPAKNFLNISYPAPVDVHYIEVYSIIGQLIDKIDMTYDFAKRINVSDWENGMYVVKLLNSNHQVIAKKVITKID